MPKPDSVSGASRSPHPIDIFEASLRLFFNLLYHQFAWTYDIVAWMVSLGAWQKWVLSVLPYLDGSKTLEIGFGPGHLQSALHRKGVITFGLDESRQMGRITARRLTRQGVQPRLVRGNALVLPFAEWSFHQVVLTFPSEYILNRPCLAEIDRVLADDGVVIMLPLAWITGHRPVERVVAWLTRVTGEAPEWHEESLEPLKRAGFNIDSEMVELSSSKILIIRMTKSIIEYRGKQSLQ
jgi:ubiquinone/menaquinone biosynthesis C-methylase UbiE